MQQQQPTAVPQPPAASAPIDSSSQPDVAPTPAPSPVIPEPQPPKENSRKLNIPVLSASMAEHQQQIHRNLVGPIQKFFLAVYEDAKKLSVEQKQSDLRVFQEKLRGIQKWNQRTTEKVVELIQSWIPNKKFNLGKILKTLVVGKTMLLVSVADPHDPNSGKVRVDVPNVEQYVQNVLVLTAEQLYSFPSLIKVDRHDNEQEYDLKTHKLRQIIHSAVDNAILDLLPSESVNTYLEGAMDAQQFDCSSSEAAPPAIPPPAAPVKAPDNPNPPAPEPQSQELAKAANEELAALGFEKEKEGSETKEVSLHGGRHSRHHRRRHYHHLSDDESESEPEEESGEEEESPEDESGSEPESPLSPVRKQGHVRRF